MSQDSVTTAPFVPRPIGTTGTVGSNNVPLFYLSRPAFESSRDDLFPQYPMGFYNLPAFRNGRENLSLPIRPESVRSDTTTVTYADEDIYGREGDILRSMGYSRCLCLGLISTGIPDWLHPTQDFNATSTQGRVPFTFRNFFEKLWDGFLRR